MAEGISKKLGSGGHEQEAYDTATGKYVSENEAVGSNTTNKSFSFHLKSGVKLNISGYKQAVKEKEKLAKQYNGQFKKHLSNEKIEFLQNSSHEELENVLLANTVSDFDKEKLSKASFHELQDIVASQMILEIKNELNNKILNTVLEISNKKEEFQKNNLTQLLIDQGLDPNYQAAPHIWKSKTPGLEDYHTLKEKDSIKNKLDYYNTLLEYNEEHPEIFSVSEEKANQLQTSLNNLKDYISLGEKYEEIKQSAFSQIESEYVDQIDSINQEIDLLPSDEAIKDFQNKFTRYGDLYSQQAKDDAVWCKDMYESDAEFAKDSKEQWKTMSSAEQSALRDYTGNYSKYNEPLRKIHYAGSKSFGFSVGGSAYNAITNMTNAIDKCVSTKNVWIQRGIEDTAPIFFNEKSNTHTTLNSIGAKGLQSLVGTTFTEDGFFSAGAAKDTGFHHKPVIINTYCPKGTKMCFIRPFSVFSGENEMILQRGYSYKITKVENAKNGKIYIDCEVILDSDQNKPVGDELKTQLHEHY